MPMPRTIRQFFMRFAGRQKRLELRALKACQIKDVDELKACLDDGLAVDAMIKDHADPMPLIFHVAHHAFGKGLRLLLDKGADPMATTPSWDHPATNDHVLLALAHFNGTQILPMVRMLVEAGADVDDSRGWSLDWDKTVEDENGDPIGEHGMMSFREVVIQKKSNFPEWLEVLAFADNFKRAHTMQAHLCATVPEPDALVAREVLRF